MVIGLFRDVHDWARVRLSDGREIDVPKTRYVAAKHKPNFQDLPLEDELDAWRAAASR